MKTILIILICFGANFSFGHNFDGDWNIILMGTRNIWDEHSVESAKRGCENLQDEIKDYMNSNDVNTYERQELIELKGKANGLEEFIQSVLLGGSYPISIGVYNMAVSEIGGTTSTVSSTLCMKVVKFEYNGFVSLLAFNDQNARFDIVCNYAEVGSSNTGEYTATVTKQSVRQMTDNRIKKAIKTWRIRSINCVLKQ